MQKYVFRAFILFIILLFIPIYSYSWTSVTNWENGQLDGWTTWNSAGTATAGVTMSNPQPDKNTTTLRITTPSGTKSDSGLQIAGASRVFDSENEMWSKYYLYYPSEYTWHPIAEKISGWRWPSNSSNNMLLVWNYGALHMNPQLGWHPYVNYSSNTGYSPSQMKNHWYKFIEHVKMNTPGKNDGVYQLWVDDKLVMDYTNVPYRNIGDTSGFTKFMLLLVWGGQGGNITLGSDMYNYYGTSIVSSERLSYGGSIGPPSSPYNLVIK